MDVNKEFVKLCLEADKSELAVEFYEQSIKVKPDSIYFYKGLAELYKKLNQDERAYEVPGRFIKRNPNDKEGYLARGTLEDYTQVIKIYPNDADLYYKRGYFYDKQKDYKHAVEDYTRAIELSPKLNKYYFSFRGRAYEALGDYEKALADYDKVPEIEPNDSIRTTTRQWLLDKMKK